MWLLEKCFRKIERVSIVRVGWITVISSCQKRLRSRRIAFDAWKHGGCLRWQLILGHEWYFFLLLKPLIVLVFLEESFRCMFFLVKLTRRNQPFRVDIESIGNILSWRRGWAWYVSWGLWRPSRRLWSHMLGFLSLFDDLSERKIVFRAFLCYNTILLLFSRMHRCYSFIFYVVVCLYLYLWSTSSWFRCWMFEPSTHDWMSKR